MDVIGKIEAEQMRELPPFRVGDMVSVRYKIIEGKNERMQTYTGLVLALNNSGVRQTMTVRKISHGVGVERVFPVHSPKIGGIDVISRGKVRQAKIYYMRGRIGKAAMKVKKLLTPKQKRGLTPRS